MFVFSNLFNALANAADIVITIYTWLVIIRVILSWVSFDPHSGFTQFLVRVTEPVLSRIRRVLPDFGGLDLSPVILIFGLYIVESIVVGTFRDIAIALR